MSKDVEMILQPAEITVAGDDATKIKIFCADRKLAIALLRDIIMFAGAHNDVMDGKTTEDLTKKLAHRTQVFLLGIGDRLMIDCGLNEKDISNILEGVSENLKYRLNAQPQK